MIEVFVQEPALLWPLAGGVLALGILLISLVRRRRSNQSIQPRGLGAALAYCLDGDLSEARTILESRIRQREGDLMDTVVGLIAVLRAQGELQRARGILEQLQARGTESWVDVLRIRLELDAGETAVAADYALSCGHAPLELAIAALARDGRWPEALKLYRQRTNRKTRSSRIEAELMAGGAAVAFKQGQERAARRALKKALSLSQDALLPLIVASRYHPSESERHTFRERLAERWPWTLDDFGETISLGSSSHVVQKANDLYTAGRIQGALAALRDHLDVNPTDWTARSQYAQWVLEEENPRAWRSELGELTTLFKDAFSEGVEAHCSSCGLAVSEPVLICPRCDGVGTMGRTPRDEDLRPRYLANPAGSSLHEFLAGPNF